MKSIARVLVVYLSLLALSPAACGAYEALRDIDLCCVSNNSCGTEPAESKKSSDEQPSKDQPCSPCSSCYSCVIFCTSIPEFDFQLPEFTIRKKLPFKSDGAVSSYSSDCWNPPEMS